MEQKHYPRDPQRDQIHTGRVRVQLINEEREFCNDLLYTCRYIFQLAKYLAFLHYQRARMERFSEWYNIYIQNGHMARRKI